MGQVVTFYSYKGGVGRSMSLANVAHIMAWRGASPRKVLMIDWDLEAPGLHKFFYDQLKINFRAVDQTYAGHLNKSPGLIDFLTAVKGHYEKFFPSTPLGVVHAETKDAQAAFDEVLKANPLEKYLLTVAPPEGAAKGGGLWLLKAGDQSSGAYTNLVRGFPWQGFFDRFGSFFVLFREYLESQYGAVLIDSRTGLTDIGDICTRIMPEKLVGVFVPNEQNIEGLMGVMKDCAEYRLASRDPRGLMVFPLASRIDPSRSVMRRTWWKGGVQQNRTIAGYEPQFETLLKALYNLEECDLDTYFDETQLPHDADYAFGEEVAARDPSSGRLGIGASFVNLTRYLEDDRAPWETRDAVEARPVAVELAGPSPSRSRIAIALALMLLGLAIGIAGPGLDQASSPDLKPFTQEVRVGQRVLRFTIPRGEGEIYGSQYTKISGFGLGHLTINVESPAPAGETGAADQKKGGKADNSPATEPMGILLELKVFDKGSVKPDLLFLDNQRALSRQVTLTSSWIGTTIFEASRLGSHFDEASRLTPSADFVEVSRLTPFIAFIQYTWPIALIAATIGGSLLGLGLSQLVTPVPVQYNPRTAVTRAIEIVGALAASAFTILVYVSFISPGIEEAWRFATPLIMAAAAGGATFQRSSIFHSAIARLAEAPRPRTG